MVRPLEQFGGWLKFFYITAWIAAILGFIILALLLFGVLAAENTTERIESFIALLGIAIYLILVVKMIKIIKIKEATTPVRIVNFMHLIIIFAVVFGLFEGIFYYLTQGVEGLSNLTETGRAIVRMLIWYAIWTSYLRKSKRVQAFYGKNA
jgi:hypothetical protein